MRETDRRTIEEVARDLMRASNKYDWCAAHCNHYVDANWDRRIKHYPDCPWLVR